MDTVEQNNIIAHCFFAFPVNDLIKSSVQVESFPVLESCDLIINWFVPELLLALGLL